MPPIQSAVLTVPLFLGVLIGARRGHTWTHRALAVVAGAAGGLAWAIPLLVLSGGRPLSVLTRTDLLTYFEVVANG